MRHLLLSFCWLACLLPGGLSFIPSPASAEDEPQPAEPTKAESAPVALPPFGLGDIEPAADTFPEDFTAAGGETMIPETAPSVSAFLALARAASIDSKRIDARCLPMQGKGGATGVAGWVTIDAAPAAFTTALAAAAAKHGWLIKNLASPMRVAIAWSSTEASAASILDWQAELAVRSLCRKSWTTIVSASNDREVFIRGMRLLGSAQAIEAKAAPVYYLQGRILEGRRQPGGALAAFRAALAKDVKYPLSDRWTVEAASRAGSALLMANAEEVLDEAVAVLEAGVAAEDASETPRTRFGNRYNLACAYARQGKKDLAFRHLEESLRYLKMAWEEDKARADGGMSLIRYEANYNHALTADSDMEPLRGDERWKPLMAKFHPDAKPAATPAKEKDREKKPAEPKAPEKAAPGK